MERAPEMPECLKERDILYSPKSSANTFNDTLLYCSQMLGHVHWAHNFEVRASFDRGTMLDVSFKIYTVIFEEVELTGIFMDLLHGDYFKYQTIFRLFNERIQESYPSNSHHSRHLKKLKT